MRSKCVKVRPMSKNLRFQTALNVSNICKIVAELFNWSSALSTARLSTPSNLQGRAHLPVQSSQGDISHIRQKTGK